MSAGRVLAIDVDGTICERGTAPSERTIEALRRIGEHWQVCLCTGRQYVGVASIASNLRLTMPQVVSEGALVVSPVDGSEIYAERLDSESIDLVVRTARKYATTAVIGGGGMTAAETWNADIDYMLSYGDPEPEIVGSLTAFEAFRPTIVLLIDRHDSKKLAALELALGRFGDLSVRRSARGYLSVVPAGTSKATGLRRAMEIHGFDYGSSTIVAIGDGANDLPLFREARLAVAMGNATDSVRSAAHVVAPSVADDGVAWAIERVLLGDFERLENPGHGD